MDSMSAKLPEPYTNDNSWNRKLSNLDKVPEIPENGVNISDEDCLDDRPTRTNSEYEFQLENSELFQEDILDIIPKPPDGGYGWVIVFACFVLNLLSDGIKYAPPLFFQSFIIYFDTTLTKVSLISSLCAGTAFFCGPIFAALINANGFRVVTIAGSLISALSLILTIFAPCVEMIIVFNGFLLGFGIGCIQTAAFVCTGYYFSTKRALASGIAVSGSGLGIFIMPILTEIFIETYQWQGAILLLSGITLNCAVLGTLLRPLKADVGKLNKKMRGSSSDYNSCSMVNNTETNLPETVKVGHKKSLDKDFYEMSSRSNSGTSKVFPNEVDDTKSSNKKLDKQESFKNSIVRKTNLHEIPYRGTSIPNMENLKKQRSSMPFLTTERKERNQSLVVAPIKRYHSVKQPNRIIMERKLSSYSAGGKHRMSICLEHFPKRNSESVQPPLRKLLLLKTNSSRIKNHRPSLQFTETFQIDKTRQILRRKMTICLEELEKPFYRKDVLHSGSIASIPEFRKSVVDTMSYLTQVSNIPLSDFTEDNNKKTSKLYLKIQSAVLDTFHMLAAAPLFVDLKYLCLCIAYILANIGDGLPIVYVVNTAMKRNVSSSKAAFLISLMGIGSMFGRMFFGWLSCLPRFQAMTISNITWMLSGVMVCLIPFAYSYVLMILVVFIFGFVIGGPYAVVTSVLIEIVGLDRLLSSFGLLRTFQGIGASIGPPLGALLSESTNNDDIIYIFGGSLLIIASLMMFSATKFKLKSWSSKVSIASAHRDCTNEPL